MQPDCAMREIITTWTETPRGPIVEEAQNDRVSLEGTLRRQWASAPNRTSAGWREGLVAGNGVQGLVLAGKPGDETLCFQHVDFVIPSPHPRCTPPDIGQALLTARLHAMEKQDDWAPENTEKTTVYSFHPGAQLRVVHDGGTITRYSRAAVLDRGELQVQAEEAAGGQRQRHFVSCTDDLVVSEYAGLGEGGISLSLSMDLPEEMEGFGWWKFGIAP